VQKPAAEVLVQLDVEAMLNLAEYAVKSMMERRRK